jgi:ABC-type multidrug transport system ATPase subunit/ABC-type multidrug transport system permease subunit
MPPERFDWSDRQEPQAGPAQAGHASAGLAEVSSPQNGAPRALPDLLVRTRRSDHQVQAGTTFSVGRDPKSDIVMTDSRVSWRHGVLRIDGEQWIFEDLGSTNGTFLGSQRLGRIDIGAECVVRLGNPEDGPILRCMLQPTAPVSQPAPEVRADHPGTALSVPAAPQAPPAPQTPPAPGLAAPDLSGRPGPEGWWQPTPQEQGPRSPAPHEPTPRESFSYEPTPLETPPREQAPREQAPREQAPREQGPREAFPHEPTPREAFPPEPVPGEAYPHEPTPREAPPPNRSGRHSRGADAPEDGWRGGAPAPDSWGGGAPGGAPAQDAWRGQAPAQDNWRGGAPAPDSWGGGNWPAADPGTGRSPIDPRGSAEAAWSQPIRRDVGPGSPAPNLLPSVDRRPTSRMPLPAKAMRIGRTPDNELVLSDLDVSRHHAELRKSTAGSYEIVDLNSHNGTYVNGQRVTSKVLTENDLIGIGHSTFRLKDGELVQFVDDGEVTFSAQDLVVTVGGGKVLLDHVTFPIPERCLLGVIGPSGAGKSTLLGALTGMRPADTGLVLYDNRDLYRDYAELRYRIGLVPQESVLHTQLTARRALQYSAELRFPADTKASERNVRVDEVMAELGLTKHANTRADRLSGGQLKRVNVAQELLTKPSLLFLDEPTSGLDPGLDKSVMEQMRDLAHDGRTVVVVTHSVANLDNCDRLLVLVPGGRIAFYGPPEEGLAYFGQPGWAEVFQAFEQYPDRDWAAQYKASSAYRQYILDQQPRPGQQSAIPQAAEPEAQRRGGFAQMRTLTRRYLRVIAADRGYLIFMAVLPIVLGLLINFVGTDQGLVAKVPHTNEIAEELLLMLTICACLSGTASSARELVKERSIYIRERAAGLSSGAYLFSKVIVLGVITIVQSAVLVLIGLFGEKMPAKGAILGFPLLEIGIGIAVLSLASMCLGLLISALVSTSEKAMPFLVLITMAQVILSGGVVSLVHNPPLEQLAYIAPARWGFGAVASTVNLNVIGVVAPGSSDPLWAQSSGNWLKDMGVLVGLAIVFTLIAWIRLLRLGPRRRKS